MADIIETDRTVTVQAGENGSVAIEGTAESSITNSEYVTMTATAASGYEFSHWVQVAGDGTETEASRENPFIYLGKDEATFKAYFIENIWGVPSEDWSDRGDITNKQYLTSITCVQEENTTEIYSASKATDGLFVPVATMINAAKGSQFTINWQGDGNIKYCYLSAYIDLNKDGDFDDAGELIMVKGTLGGENNSVEKGPMQVLLPYDMPTGITHIRLRFDGAWKKDYNQNTKAFPASNAINRRCYEIALNVTEHSAGNSHIVITSNNTEWGTVRNITGVTGEDINVPSGTEICMEAFPKDGYMFVHWLDKYGRVASTDASFYYTPCESGEFTAVFKKIGQETVVIDGWEFGIRTQTGVPVTTKLANGVKPEAGKKYYIYAPTRPTNNGEYVNRYLYNNGGTLTLSTTESTAANYLWLCSIEDGKYVFQNVADPTKYLKHKGLASAPYGFELGTGTTYYEGITMQSVPGDGETRNLFFVINDDGSGFNQSTRAHNQSTENHTTDFVFTEVSVPVVLTSVRKSGNHDLVIPETVEILGEQCKIVGFDNNLFKDNKDLWSISLPATIEQLSSNVLFSTSVKGENTPTAKGDNNPDNKIQVIDLGFTLKNSEAWTIRATYKSDGVSTFNEWGSPLLYPNENGTGSELFYLSSTNEWSTCWHVRAPFSGLGNDYFKEHTNTKISTFIAAIENKGNGKAVVTITNSLGETQTSSEVTFSYDNISAFSAKLPKGLDITNFEVLVGAEPDPFEGCTNLLNITVADGGCQGGYTVEDREFKNASGDVLHTLPSEDKREKLLALSELIDLTNALIAEVATNVNPTGKATALTLSTTAGENYYIYSNAEIREGAIGNLLDNDNESYIHTTWEKNSADGLHHYLRVYLGEDPSLTDFSFSYVTRNNVNNEKPKQITVAGCDTENGSYETIAVLTDLPNASATTYVSPVYNVNGYKYLRFMVDDTYRDLAHSGHKAYSMAKFDLFKLTSSAEVAPKYANLAGVTATDVEGVYDSMAAALYVYNNGGTAKQLQDAYDVLKPLYDDLNAKKDNVFNGVYNINYKGAPVFIGYTEAFGGLTGASAGYRLVNPNKDNTSEGHLANQENAIKAKVAADALFTIVPNGDGYTISAQGQYMRATGAYAQWSVQAFDTDVANAGTYLFEETGDEFKLKSTINVNQQSVVTNYVNDWGPVFGNDDWNKPNLSTFTLTKVTEYTLNVPANGATTFCLPFNVVLPAGLVAYDVTAVGNNAKGEKVYQLTQLAASGEKVMAGTPVIVKGSAGEYTLGVTIDNTDAKGALEGSLLRGNFVSKTLAVANVDKYTFTDDAEFTLLTALRKIAANSVWMEFDVTIEVAIKEGVVVEPDTPDAPDATVTKPELGKVYRIKNYTVNTPDEYKYHYLVNSNVSIAFPTSVEETDKSAMWVCTSADEVNHKYKFVSALGTAAFGWQGVAEDALEYTISDGTIQGTVTLVSNNISLALTTEAWNNSGNVAFNQASNSAKAQAEYWSTDWYLEEVENPGVSYTASINKGNMWATMYLPYAVTIPQQGVDVYYAVEDAINENKITLTQFSGTIPARTAVLLHRAGDAPSTEATENFEFALAEDVEAVASNLFEGKIMQTAIDATGARVYLLVNYNAAEKFYWMAAEYDANCQLSNEGGYVKCDANKCYLKLPEQQAASSYSFRYEGTTGVEEVKGENGKVKTIYDLQGRKLTEITKPGFYIVDGEKVWIK